jgi:hypothetical protein
VDTEFWRVDELKQIARLGFSKLLIDVSERDAEQFAVEACGSPQLMQQICLQGCFRLGIRKELNERTAVRFDAEAIGDLLEQAAAQTDYSTLTRRLHQGAKIRGTERKVHQFIDGTQGDVYRCVLLAITHGQPRLDFPYKELMHRVEQVCEREAPASSSVTQACRQMARIARTLHPDQRIVEFDDSAGSETFSIVDPYLLFYLRASGKLGELSSTGLTS